MLREDRRHNKLRGDAHDACRAPTRCSARFRVQRQNAVMQRRLRCKLGAAPSQQRNGQARGVREDETALCFPGIDSGEKHYLASLDTLAPR